MSNDTMKKIRIAVGTANHLLSSIWFASPKKGCLFLGAVGLGGTLKASLHASGQSHVRFGPDIKEIANTYAMKWQRPPTPESGVTHVASVLFPTDFLKGSQPLTNKVSNLILLEHAPAGEAIELSFFYSYHHMEELEPKLSKIGLPLFHIGMESGEQVSLVVRNIKFDPFILGPFGALSDPNGSVALPLAKWMDDNAKDTPSIGGLSSILFNEPSIQGGVLRMIQVSGLALVKSTSAS